MQGIPLLVLTFAVLYLGRKLLLFVKALQAIQYAIDNNLMIFTYNIFRYHPGKRIFVSSSHLNALLPKIRGTSLGVNHLFVEKHKCERP